MTTPYKFPGFLRTALAAAACAALFSAPQAKAATIWNEAVNGDLSNTQASPTTLTLALGTNAVIGTVGTGDSQDWLTLNVPHGFQLSQIILASYSSTDAQGFTGVQSGAVFTGSSNSAGSYLGYAHFGTGATNPSTPTNLIGADLLPIMATAPSAQDFTAPLNSGSYSFLIQQLGAPTSYEFDYVLTAAAAPEPTSLALVSLAGVVGLAVLLVRRRA